MPSRLRTYIALVLLVIGSTARQATAAARESHFSALTAEEHRYLHRWVGQTLPLKTLLDTAFSPDYFQITSIGEPPSLVVWWVKEQRDGQDYVYFLLAAPEERRHATQYEPAKVISFLPRKLVPNGDAPRSCDRCSCVDAEGVSHDEKVAFTSNLETPSGKPFIVTVVGDEAVVIDRDGETLRLKPPPRQLFCAGDEISDDVP